MEIITAQIVRECLGWAFDGFLYLSAVGSRGEILLVWQSEYVTVTNPHMTANALTASISIGGDQAWWFTGVYGPQGVGAKHAFLQELRDIRDLHAGPWMVAGDFNLIIDPEDKNQGVLHHAMMGRFRRTLSLLELKEI